MILLQVLGMAAVVAMMAAAMLALQMQPAQESAGLVSGMSRRLAAQSAINKVYEAWTARGVCLSDVGLKVFCSGNDCDCTCEVTGLPTVVSRSGTGAACLLRVEAP
jgi:hypothetical protein